MDWTFWIIVAFVLAFVCGFAGMAIGRTKGRETEGFWWGFLLEIIGIVLRSPIPEAKE